MVICAALSGRWQTLSSPGLSTATTTTTTLATTTRSAFFGCSSGRAAVVRLGNSSSSSFNNPAFLLIRLPFLPIATSSVVRSSRFAAARFSSSRSTSSIATASVVRGSRSSRSTASVVRGSRSSRSTSRSAGVPFSSSLRSTSRNNLLRLIFVIGADCSSITTYYRSNRGGGGGSFPARFRRCESPACRNRKTNSFLGMTTSTTAVQHSSSSAAVAAQIHGKEALMKKNEALLKKKSSIEAKEDSPVASLPEEIPLEKLKVAIPPILNDGESCSSDEDNEVERSGNGAVSKFGGLENVQAQDSSDTLVLGKNFHELSLVITEPEMDDEVTGDKEAYMAGVLARYRKTLVERTKFHLGYPYNLDFNYQALSQLQHFSINNLGDPFIESNYGVHSRQFEVGVLDWFARLWDLEKEEYWGYITNCGTEGNLHGILVGREVLPDGILYASKDSHYSVFKAARMYRMEVVKVDTLLSGEIDCNDLTQKLLERAEKPAILNVNIGTTVKGAVDDLDRVLESLKQAGFTEDRFYIHCDGALFGLMMPFVKTAPRVTFKKPIGSVSVSGHKFIGCPMPCGIQITRAEHINYLSRNVEYLASRDATIMGSRNGHGPLFLWYTLNRKGYRGFQKEVQRCLRNAYYLKYRLRDAGFGVMLNELSSTVVFERPQNENFVRKWQLACQGSIAHAVVMPSVTVEKLDSFVNELIESRANCFPDGKVVVPCIVEEVGPENCACSLHLNCTPVTKVAKEMNGGIKGFRA